ncbi:MAG: DNA methyltransferase [Candidatus Caldarchaeum sp.]
MATDHSRGEQRGGRPDNSVALRRQGVSLRNRESEFFDALENVFVGVPIEGESGYINLMKIKSRYYREVMRPKLEEEIGEALRPFPGFREELFDKLYTFFKRYFAENGSLGFFFTPYHESVYDQIYTSEEDVVLYWRTSRLYYVKTDRLFREMDVEVDGFRFSFDVSMLEHKKANEKRSLVFEFSNVREDGVLVFRVLYSEGNKKTKMDEIRRGVKDALGLKSYTEEVPSEETLEKAFRIFGRQSEVDFFICKDARSFLREQFDLWMWQYLLGKPGEEPQTEWTERRIRELQVLKRIAYRVIDLIAAFEDELVKIWNKPKFVLRSNYVITLDRIFAKDQGLLEEIVSHPGFAEQVREWQDLGMVDENFSRDALWEVDLTGKRLHPRYQFLPLDTRYFKDLELRISGLFENLDESLDGWLIKSENYQVLNTILPKFRGRVQCVYIDPPYNSPETEIQYVNRFRDSSWLALMENRLSLLKNLMGTKEIAVIIAVDDYEIDNLAKLVLRLLPEYDRNIFVINHHPQGSPKHNISRTHEYAIVLTPQGSDFMRISRSSRHPEERPFMRTGTGENNFRHGRPNSFYSILVDPNACQIVGIEDPPPPEAEYPRFCTPEGWLRIYPIDSRGRERVWRKTADSARQMLNKGLLGVKKTDSGYLIVEKANVELIKPVSNWVDSRYNAGAYGSALLASLFGSSNSFSYPKSIYTVQDFLYAVTHADKDSLILDFFAGSGTTAHAVINLNREDGGRRKYILVEVAEYFYTVLLPRIKKVVFSDRWKDGKAHPEGKGISHFIKYYELEQYEDTLRRTKYLEKDLFMPPSYEDPCQYIFLRDPKMLEALDVDLEAGKVETHLERLYENIDLPETLSNLTGKWVKRIVPDPENPTKPGKVEFADGDVVDLKNLDWRIIKPLIWW